MAKDSPASQADAGASRTLDYASRPSGQRRQSTLVHILLIVGIVAMLVSIVLPSLSRTRYVRPRCPSNLRQIGQALFLYANDNRGSLADSFETLLQHEDLTSTVFVCDGTSDSPAKGATTQAVCNNLSKARHCSYVYAAKGSSAKFANLPPNSVLVYEPLTNHRGAGINVLFADGHCEFICAPAAQKLIAEVTTGHNPPRAEVVGQWQP